MRFVINMVWKKDTKNCQVYATMIEPRPGEDKPPCDQVYLQKSAVGPNPPKAITVTIEEFKS